MKLKLILIFIALLIPALVFSQQSIQEKKIDDLLTSIKQMRESDPNAERQSQRLKAESHLDFSSQMAKGELSRLLNRNALEEFLSQHWQRKVAKDGYDWGEWRASSRSSIPMTKANNQILTAAEQSVVIPVLEDFQVNDEEGACAQLCPAIAVAKNGDFMVVWQDLRNGHFDIYAQCYNGSGESQGKNFMVNDSSEHNAENPTIAVDGSGNFVVAWTDGRNGGNDIYTQLLSSDGLKQGANFKVNDAIGSFEATFPAIAMDDSGNFMVVWNEERNGNKDIYAQYYNRHGIKQTNNYKVNDDLGSRSQAEPAIAADGNGNFVVVWQDCRDGVARIFAQRYSKNATKLGDNFKVDDDDNNSSQHDPAVAADFSGNFMVVWTDDRDGNEDIWAQLYATNGAKQGNIFKVNDDISVGCQGEPAITADGNGNFVVVWQDFRDEQFHLYAQQYQSSGAKLGDYFKVNDDSRNYFYFAVVGADGIGNFVVVWTEWRNIRWDLDIYAQRYSADGIKQEENIRVNDDHGTSVQYLPTIGVDDSGNFVVTWSDERHGWRNVDVYAQRFSSDGIPQGANFKVNEDSSNCWFETPAAMAMSGKGNFIVVWMDRRNRNSDIYGQLYNPDGERQGENFKINDDDNWQESPSVDMDDNGNFVAVWQSNRTEDYDIYAQRYAATGERLGDNFRVNDDSGVSSQYIPAIAMHGRGDFVVVWVDERNGNWDIYGQRYSAIGAEQGENFRVNDDSDSNSHVDPAVDMDSQSNFIVTWSDDRHGNWDIYAQRYSANGVKLGANFRVNADNSDSTQGASAIALDGNGDFIVAWTDGRDGNWDIYAQIFDSQGTMLGTNYRVNNDIGAKDQMYPKVKMVNSHIYYTWVDNRIERQKYDIFARIDRFSITSIPIANRFEGVPVKYALYPNYPNPFNPTTTISYALPEAAHVQVQIFDVNGREVRRLVDQMCSAGVHSVVWDATDKAQQKVSSGIYICRFSAGDVVLNRKLILVK